MPATLLQKTRGSQSSTNTPAPNADLQPITADEQNCLKQTTRGQAGVLPDESIPFVDLQNHADNPVVSTDKTGFKNYFSQNSLNRFFGWTGSAFNTYAGSAGKILPSFLDPSWLATLFTVNSVIDDKKNIRSFKMYRSLSAVQLNGGGVFPSLGSITHSTFLSVFPITKIPVTELNSTVFITSDIEIWLVTSGDITTDAEAQKQAKIRPFWREETSPNVWSGKNYLVSDERNIAFFQFYRAMKTFGGVPGQLSFRYPLSIEVAIPRTNLNNLDFGFDVECNNVGPGGITNFLSLQLEVGSGNTYNSIKIEQFKT